MKKYSHSYSVILDNMDMTEYRLRPISAIMYLQDAFARFTATKGMAAYDLFPKNIYWIVGEFNIDFTNKLPFWSEEITVEIWISELSKLKIYTDYNLYTNGKLFSKGNACWFLIDSESKRPVKTDFFAEKTEICPEFVLGEHKKFSLIEAKEKIAQLTHKINLSDLDFNNHVNNKSYINLAEQSVKTQFKNEYSIKNMRIKFSKETFLDDILNCETYTTEEKDTYLCTIKKENDTVCEIIYTLKKMEITEDILHANLKVKNEEIMEFA